VFWIAVLLLAGSPAFAQSAGDNSAAGVRTNPAHPPPPGGATIPPEQRSNATKDVPMGDGKPKASDTAPPAKRSK